jgi:hypothetical protein
MRATAHRGIPRETDIEAKSGEPPVHELDKPRTYKDAAGHLGVGYAVVQRAARRGLVPVHHLGSSRRYVTLRDFLKLMNRDTNR